MASPFSPLLLPLLLLLLTLSLSDAARPCKTLIISTYSFSLLPQNPNPNLITIVAEFRPEFFHPHPRHHRRFFLRRPRFASLNDRPAELEQIPRLTEDFSSFRDRTKDILSVVASLLFGAACGALTAGTMFLIWSLFTHTNESYRSLDGFSSGDDDEVDEEDIFNPKKKGYVAIPAAPTTPEADPVNEAAPAKESA